MATLLEHPAAEFTHRVKTSPVALDICQSTFGMDITDVVAEALDDAQIPTAARSLFSKLSHLETSSEVSRTEVSRLLHSTLGITALEYAFLHMSLSDVVRLLQQGEDASLGAPLVYAAWRDAPELVKPLLQAGANVNACNACGWTALHWAGNGVCLTFFEDVGGVRGGGD